jgi:hypothetical protein
MSKFPLLFAIPLCLLASGAIVSCDSTSSPTIQVAQDTLSKDTVRSSTTHVEDKWECKTCPALSDSELADTLSVGVQGPTRYLTKGDWDKSMIRLDSGIRYLVTVTASEPTTTTMTSAPSVQSLDRPLNRFTPNDPVAKGTAIFVSDRSGWQYLWTQETSSNDSGTYSYLVSVAPPVPDDSVEPNDDNTSVMVQADSSLILRTMSNGKKDGVMFQAQIGMVYEVDLYGQIPLTIETDASVRTYTPGSSFLVYGDSKTAGFWVYPGVLGNYGYRIYPRPYPSPNPGEPDDSLSMANPIPTDSTVLDRYMEVYGVDWFRFQATSGKHYKACVPFQGKATLNFYDSLGTQLPSTLDYDYVTTFFTYQATRSGTVYVKATPNSSSILMGPYGIAIKEF